MNTLSDADFTSLRDYLLDEAGLVFDESRRAALVAVVAERLRATGADGVPAYVAGLARDDDERSRLLDRVTVQETHFFRNTPQMEALRRRILPELLRRSAGRRRPLTIWSAGCSTGEEPYTLAMLLLELAPLVAGQDRARILATDLSAEALRVAGRATYAGRTLETVPAVLRDRWFEPRPGGALGVREPVRRMVDFQVHNLVTEPPPFAPGEVDLVVCRNVTIYFPRPVTTALVGSFFTVLAEGGYLLLGHSETLWQVSDAFALVPIGDAFVYRRAHRVEPARRSLRRPVRRVPARSAPVVAAAPVASAAPPAQPAPRPADARQQLATARERMTAGDYPAAAQAAAGAADVDPLLSEAYVLLGRARAAGGDDAGAVDPLRKAVYLDPAAGDAHFHLAVSLARLGQPAAAAVSYRAAAAALPGLDADGRAELLGGREPAELVALCTRLALACEALAGSAAVAAAGGAW